MHEPDRELRFRLMLDYVELSESTYPSPAPAPSGNCRSLTWPVAPVRSPAGCCTGSRPPQVVALDIDPLLLDLARDAFAGDERVEVVARQLADADWTEGPRGGFDAVLTATAMHWLPPRRPGRGLCRRRAAAPPRRHLRERGPPAGGRARTAGRRGRVARREYLRDTFATWGGELRPVVRTRVRRSAVRGLVGGAAAGVRRTGPATCSNGSEWHVDLLRRNGFERAGVVWRRGNDALIVAVRA